MNRLKILWLSHFVPYPPKGGCFQRSYNLIKRVGVRHDVHLVAIRHKRETHPETELAGARDRLLRHCRTVDIVDLASRTQPVALALRAAQSLLTGTPLNVSLYSAPKMTAVVRQRASETRFDVAHFDTIGLAQYFGDVGEAPRIMTHHGAESHMIRRRIQREPNLLKRALFYHEWRTLEDYERRMCPGAIKNIVMSDDDARLMGAYATEATFVPVENGVDMEYFTQSPPRDTHSLIFAGRLDQYSNRDGILFFMREVWPMLRTRFPGVRIHIIGSNPPDALVRMGASDRHVVVTGFVPDVRPFFLDAAVAICPLRDGGGTRVKVLDALAQGMPIVATTVACEGIDVVPERDVLIADSAEAFVAQIGRVFDDPALRFSLSGHARRLAESRYGWDALADKLARIYEEAASERKRVEPDDYAVLRD